MGKVEGLQQVQQGFIRTKGYVAELFQGNAIEIENLRKRVDEIETKLEANTPKVEGEVLNLGGGDADA